VICNRNTHSGKCAALGCVAGVIWFSKLIVCQLNEWTCSEAADSVNVLNDPPTGSRQSYTSCE